MAFSKLPLHHCNSHHILAKPVCSLKKKNLTKQTWSFYFRE